MRQHPDSIPYVSVRPSGVTFYNLPERTRGRTEAQKEAEKHLEDNDHGGHISHKAKRRISQAIDWMLYLANEKEFEHFKFKKKYRFRINMVTVTLSSQQVHSDIEIKNVLLNHLLIDMRVRWGVQHYMWRAEPQRNGNIHFHILTDKFIPWSELRNAWNRIQDKLKYVQNNKGFKAGWTPNSTDVHSVKKVRKLGAYLAKYCTKESDVRKIEGRNWGLSQSLSRMKCATDLRCSEVIDDLAKLWSKKKENLKEYEWHSVYWISAEELKHLGCGRLVELLEEYVQSMSKEKEYICDSQTLKIEHYEVSKSSDGENQEQQKAA